LKGEAPQIFGVDGETDENTGGGQQIYLELELDANWYADPQKS
jgi:hypothetical protein